MYIPNKRKEDITLVEYRIPVSDKDINPNEYTRVAQSMQPLNIYESVIIEFAPEGVKIPLGQAFRRYENHLYDLFKRNSFSSVRFYHFSFHSRHLQGDVYDPRGWYHPDLELYHVLVPAELVANAGNKRSAADTRGGPLAKRISASAKQTCIRFNSGEFISRFLRLYSLYPTRGNVVDYDCNFWIYGSAYKPAIALLSSVFLLSCYFVHGLSMQCFWRGWDGFSRQEGFPRPHLAKCILPTLSIY